MKKTVASQEEIIKDFRNEDKQLRDQLEQLHTECKRLKDELALVLTKDASSDSGASIATEPPVCIELLCLKFYYRHATSFGQS